jgi:hypothetical protein
VPSTPPRDPAPTAAAPSSGLRGAVERASVPVLLWLTRLPRAVPFVVLLGALVVAALVSGPVGPLLTGLVALVVGWLMYLGWPRLSTAERLGRTAVLLVAVALFLTELFPR